MMQHVATTQSEIAAFVKDTGADLLTDSGSNKQFDKILQQSTNDTQKVSSPVSEGDASSKLKSPSNEHTKKTESDTLSLPQGSTRIQSAVKGDSLDIDTQDWVSLVDNLQKLADIAQLTKPTTDDAELTIVSEEVSDEDLSNPENTINDTQNWVSLVDDLQKLADIAQLTKPTTDDAELKIISGEVSDVDLSNPENTIIDTQDWVSLVDDLQKPADIAQLTNPTTDDAELTIVSEEVSDDDLFNPENTMFVDLSLAENQTLLTTLLNEPEAEKVDVLDKLLSTQQVETSFRNSGKVEKETSNNDIKNILTLSDNKLDKVLENIAQRVFDDKKVAESLSSEQTFIPKGIGIVSSVESASKDFIAALKTGIDEFKNQLSQGREPGIDLKALISDAIAKTNESGNVAKPLVNIEQITKSVSQILDIVQATNHASEHHQDQIYSAASRDVAQIQGEQSKQIQSNQFESKFEKAINLAKPEGHQQIAEKVRWMMNTKNLVAEIRLDPAELGSMHVKVVISGETATVNFVVQSQQARDAVDTATPKLREMLAEKGIELGQSSVRQESNEQRGQGDDESVGQDKRSGNEAEDVETPEQVLLQHNIVNGALGGIDYFV
jgi:flagellar hook-length control protein FliK